MGFEPKRHLIKVQGGRNYLPVSARLIWFRQEHPDWGIETEPITIDMDKQYAIFRAKIYNAEGRLMAVGTKREDIKGFPDYLEKAETGSVGRALALCGFGTQFAPELDEIDFRQAGAPGGLSSGRFADSPQPVRNAPPQRQFDRPAQSAQRAALPQSIGTPEHIAPPIALPAQADAMSSDTETDTAVQAAKGAETVDAASNACGHCGKTLTRSQQELSVRHFGEALCPSCQKDRSRNGQTTGAARV